jgi:zinc protease
LSASPVDRSTAPAPGPLRPFHFPPIETFSLENGIPVFFCRTEGLPVATLSVVLPSGAIREDASHAGLATLTGHLLESGTDRLSGPEIAEELETLGVRLSVGTSWEVTSLDFTALAPRVDAAARMAAHLMADPVFPEAEVERLRHEQLAGILQRRADPRGLANEMASRFIFAPESPFGRPVSGTTGTVRGLTRQDAIEYHRATFTPRGAALVAAGNLSLESIRATTEAAFGGWQGPPPPERSGVVKARSESIQVVIVDRPGAVQSEIRVGHVGVARKTPDYFAILVMNTVLGGAFSSRLNLNLREKHGYTYGVSSTFVMRRQPGPFLVATAVQTEVTGAAVREIGRELARIREERVDAAELTDAQNYLAGTFPLRLQTTGGVASRLAELFIYDLPRSYLDDFAQRVLAVTAADVVEAARQRIHPERLMVLVVGDASLVRPQLEELALGEIEVVPAKPSG